MELLANIAFYRDGQQMIIKIEDLLPLLVEFCNSNSKKINEAAMLVLRNLCFHVPSKTLLLSNGELSSLVIVLNYTKLDLIILDNSGYVYTVSEVLLQRRDVVLTGGNQSTFAEKSGGVWPGVNWKHSSHMRLRRNYNLTTGYCRNKSPGTEMKGTNTIPTT